MSFAVVGILLTLLRLLGVLDCVTFQPSHPIILRENARVEIKCQHDDSGLNVMLWYQQRPQSNILSLIGYSYVGSDPNYEEEFKGQFEMTRESALKGALVRPRAEANDSGEYFCAGRRDYEAYFGQGTKLTVLDPGTVITPPKVVVLPPSLKECGGPQKTRKTLVCVASGFYPAHVTVSWYVGNEPVTAGVANDHNALRMMKNSYQITSRLSVEAKVWHNADTMFTCTVSFFNGTQTTYHSDGINGDSTGQIDPEGMTKEQFMKVTQTAKLSYVIFIVKNVVYGLFVIILAWKLGIWRSHATAKM